MNVDIWIVHFCGKIGGIFSREWEAKAFKRSGWEHIPANSSLRKSIKIHTPEEYGEYCISLGKRIGIG
jgi:hypothetical protein